MSNAVGTLESDRTPLEESIDYYVDALGLGKVEWLHQSGGYEGSWEKFGCSLLPKRSVLITEEACFDEMPMLLKHAPEVITAIAWTRLETDVLAELVKRDVVAEERLCWREWWEKLFPGTTPASERFKQVGNSIRENDLGKREIQPIYQFSSYCHPCQCYTMHTREPYQPSVCINVKQHGPIRMRFPDESGI